MTAYQDESNLYLMVAQKTPRIERPRSGFALYGIAMSSERAGDVRAAVSQYGDFLRRGRMPIEERLSALPWQISGYLISSAGSAFQPDRANPKNRTTRSNLRHPILLVVCFGSRLRRLKAPLVRSTLRATIDPRPYTAPRALTAGLFFSPSFFNRLDWHSHSRPPRFACLIVALMNSQVNPVGLRISSPAAMLRHRLIA